jgi:hypothetical protein
MQPIFPSLDSHFSQVRIGMLLILFLLCCIPSLDKKAYSMSLLPLVQLKLPPLKLLAIRMTYVQLI